MDARLERELGTLAKHVEALEQLANETDRDASFARRARGAAGRAGGPRLAQLETAERAAAEAPEPPQAAGRGAAPRARAIVSAERRSPAHYEAAAWPARPCRSWSSWTATRSFRALPKTPQKHRTRTRAPAASLRRTRDLLRRGLDQVAAAAEAIEEDASLFSGVLGKHSKIGGAVKRAGRAIRRSRRRRTATSPPWSRRSASSTSSCFT